MPKIYKLSGLSTNTKPVSTDIAAGSTYTELDTGKVYTFSASTNSWLCSGTVEPTATGIRDIRKTSTEGYVDTYTIHYTSGGETTFTVTNGINGSEAEATIEELKLNLQKEVETRQNEDTKLGDLIEKVGLYRSKTNASKWESKENSLTGYVSESSGVALRGSISLSVEQSDTASPACPTITGTSYSPTDQNSSITGTLSLTPTSSAAPFLSFTGTNDLSMGQRTLTFDEGWFKASDTNINLRLPAKSGTLITEADALGSLNIEVDDLDVTQVDITQEQYDYLYEYPKALLAITYRLTDSGRRYFVKVQDDPNFPTARFVTRLTESTIAIATLDYRTMYEEDGYTEKQVPVINLEYQTYMTKSDTESMVDGKIDKALDSYIVWTEI